MSFHIPQWKQKPPDKEFVHRFGSFQLEGGWPANSVRVGGLQSRKHRSLSGRDVVLKIPHEITDIGKEFTKEVKLVNSVRGYQNVISFKAVCIRPYAIITEYVVFSFDRFRNKKVVSSLSDFLCMFIRITISKDLNTLYPSMQKMMQSALNFSMTMTSCTEI